MFMPVIAANITSTLFQRVRNLVERGLYANPEQFLEIAAFNQIALEDGAKPADLMPRRPPERIDSDRAGVEGPADVVPATPKGKAQTSRRVRQTALPGRRSASNRLDQDFSDVMRQFSTFRERRLVSPPPTTRSAPVAEDRIWGQVNRLFPMKVASRGIAMLNVGNSEWGEYDHFAQELARLSAGLGSCLETDDKRAGRKRDELLSTGLPKAGNIASQDRFMSQFVARLTRAGEIYPGAICQYGLAAFDGSRLGLTQDGLTLAGLASPILDGPSMKVESTLSDAERQFLIHLVRTSVASEAKDFRNVLTAVASGTSTPDDLLQASKGVLPQLWSDIMTRTHVSGVVARLADLELLRRVWAGRNVTYEVTSTGRAFLSEAAQ